MKYNTQTVFYICFILLLSLGCQSDFETKPEKGLVDWIVGKWQLEDKSVYEEWKVDHDKMSGMSYVLTDGDTMVIEYLSIEKINDTLYYIPTVLSQNEGKPVPFKLENSSDKNLRFVNSSHDFPKMIEYKLIHNDSIKVTLEGTPDQKQEFLLLRHGEDS